MTAPRVASAAAFLATLAAVSAGLAATARPHAVSRDWTRFGYDAGRHNAAPSAGGITASNLGRLVRRQVRLDGTVDSSPIHLAGVRVGGARHDLLVVTTTYGKTLAVDAASGRILWRYVPPGISGWTGSSQITTATPVADPGRAYVYTASPDGRVHKLAVASGREVTSGSWPVAVTLDPTHEKLASAFNLSRGLVLVTTGGYIGDAPPYQGHVVAIRATTGAIVSVFNSLCSDRRAIIQPSSCPASDSAIWARSGAVVEPNGNLLVATGNGPWNGATNWGDSVLELSPDASRLLQNWTPTNQRDLETSDADLGSTAPALLGNELALQAGKEGKLVLLDLRRLNGRTGTAGTTTGGELQTLPTPGGGGAVFTAPAVWRSGGRTWAFVATFSATAAYRLSGRRVVKAWENTHGGTSPVLAGGLLFVYDPGGGLRVYRPTSPRPIATLAAGPGHWNSPIVAGGRIALPEGDANQHLTTGVLDIWTPRRS